MHPEASNLISCSIRPIGRLVDQFGEFWFYPTGERRRLGATSSAERSRHVFRHGALATPDRSGRCYPQLVDQAAVNRLVAGSSSGPGSQLHVDLLHNLRPPVDDRQQRVGLLGREHRHHAGDAQFIEALHPVEILA